MRLSKRGDFVKKLNGSRRFPQQHFFIRVYLRRNQRKSAGNSLFVITHYYSGSDNLKY